MDKYISRKAMLKNLTADLEHHSGEGSLTAALVMKRFIKYVEDFPATDVQPSPKWISVKDRLPDDCVEVLAYDTDCGVVIGWYDKEIGDFAADFISPLDAVTHWQPLPEKPQD